MTDPDYRDVQIETSLSRQPIEPTIQETVEDLKRRTPWFGISVAAHLILLFVLSVFPWDERDRRPEKQIVAKIEAPPPDAYEDPPPPPEPEIVEPIPTTEAPILRDYEISDHNETDDDADAHEAFGNPDLFSDSPFQHRGANAVIGVGGNAGGQFGNGRLGGQARLRTAYGGSGTEEHLARGLDWLARHQSPDGQWQAAAFMRNCKSSEEMCTGPGDGLHDVGITGLALLAFLGNGNTLNEGQYRSNVTRAVQWLRSRQDADTGLIGGMTSHAFLYDHGIATLALCEAYYFGKSPILKGACQRAVGYILRARNPYAAWRFQVPPNTENDTSVTGWMVFALKSASECGLEVEQEAFLGALGLIDEFTDPQSGRVGYTARGTLSSRVPGLNDHFPEDKGEAMTAVGLLCRFFLAQEPATTPIMQRHAELLLRRLPVWDVPGKGCDMYYWYYGSYAMYQMGGRYWDAWNLAMKEAILPSQRTDGEMKGSWDPVGPWGRWGGRVYSTALMVLCLEVYYRYGRVLGAR
jgi:hypothetical protein